LDILKEGLLHHIVVREDEHGLEEPFALESGEFIQLLKLIAEIFESEVSADLQLVAVHLCQVGAESGQRVTARTTDTDQKSVATFQVQHTVDLGNVDDRLLEQHNVHLLHLWLLVVGV